MFSTLLSRPKNSSYDPNYHFRIDTTTNDNKQVLVLPRQTDLQALDFSKPIDDEEVTYESTIPLKKRYPNLTHSFPRPSLDDLEVRSVIEETRSIIAKLITPDQPEENVQHIQYSSKNIIDTDERVIQIRKFQVDPMLPPQFKLRKNRHKTQTEDVPIVKPTNQEKLTKEDRQKWNIPVAVSNWKNNQGFTI
ncbi:uncharacterized protein SPAPADRAFT_63286, partial [Spathaspora passalidarum NRRL Y-27907]